MVTSFGPNKTPLTTIRNSAVPSWTGFVYQGMCALYVVLRLLNDDFNLYRGYFLGLEGYEDFVIQDSQKQICSFHQCKCYNQSTNFDDEFAKMEDKRAYWYNFKLCQANTPLYFHCNQSLKFSHDVTPYKNHDNTTVLTPKGVYGHISELVGQIIDRQSLPSSHLLKTIVLMGMIEHHVSFLYSQSMSLPSDQKFDWIINHPIPLSEIADTITDTSLLLTEAERARSLRYYLQLSLLEQMQLQGHRNNSRVQNLQDYLNHADVTELICLAQRLLPDVDLQNSRADRETAAESRANNLYTLMTEVVPELNYKEFNWHERGVLLSPSTLGGDLPTSVQSAKIVQNSQIAALLWDYRWIVGCVRNKEEDVLGAAKNITTMKIDHTHFSKPGKLGLLPLSDFNNGSY